MRRRNAFGVSPSCAIKLLARVRATGKLGPFKALLIGWVEEKPDITMPELAD